MVKEHIGLATTAVTVVFPVVKLGINVVEACVGFEKEPPDEDQLMLVPIPAIVALKFILSPLQIMTSEIGSMVGAGRTIISTSTSVAHSSGSGVKVYVVVLMLLVAGDQDPLTPLRLMVGRSIISPSQI